MFCLRICESLGLVNRPRFSQRSVQPSIPSTGYKASSACATLQREISSADSRVLCVLAKCFVSCRLFLCALVCSDFVVQLSWGDQVQVAPHCCGLLPTSEVTIMP